MTDPSPTVLGIDVGGSKTHGVRGRGGVVVGEAVRGAANPSSVGPADAARELDRLVDDLLAGDPVETIDAVCAGVAGADTEEARARLRDVLRRRLPGVPVHVVHDAELVLAASDLDEGIVVVSGTGSAVWGRTVAGASARAGGWGYLLGDEGSGYGVARAAVQHVLGRADEGLPLDPLARALLAASDVTGPAALLDAFYAAPARRTWAARAAAVFDVAETGDPAAAAVVDTAAAELVRTASRVGARLGLRDPVVLAGGLIVNQPLLQATVRRGLEARGFGDLRVLDTDPVHGAVRLAGARLTTARIPAP